MLFGLCGAAYHRSGTILMALTSLLAFLATLVAWVIDMVLWGIVRNRIRDTLGASILGPQNIPIDQQNPDLLAPPTTDAGTV